MAMAAVKILLLVALLQIAESVPAPDPDPGVIIQVSNIENSGCGIGGCPPKECCKFRTKTYQHNEIIDEECLKMECKDGIWKYISIDTDCGTCNVIGDPHIYTFDPSKGPDTVPNPVLKYRLQGTGKYFITQYGLTAPEFGVKGDFESCAGTESCIKDITYYEPGISITIEPPHATTGTILVDTVSTVSTALGSSQVFVGDGGAIVVFRHKHMIHNSLNCISILGTKGYSVTLCEELANYPFLYIRAVTSLHGGLYGLCNTYTGSEAAGFVKSGAGATEKSTSCLGLYSTPGGPSSRLYNICPEFSSTWN